MAAGVALARAAAQRRVPAGVWAFALLSATAADWLDGPLARRQPGGPTELGELFDIEADSWLTLWCAIAAVAGRRLPAWAVLPPALRYARRVFGMRPHRPWQRAAGAIQRAVLLGALGPSRASSGRRERCCRWRWPRSWARWRRRELQAPW